MYSTCLCIDSIFTWIVTRPCGAVAVVQRQYFIFLQPFRLLMLQTILEYTSLVKSNQIKKFYLKSVHFITIQHKLSRAFQTDMHNKLHKLNTAQ